MNQLHFELYKLHSKIMKFLKRKFVLFFALALILYLVLTWGFYAAKSDHFSIWRIFNALIAALVIAGGNMSIMYAFLKPKLNFLSSDSKIVPPFGNKLEKSFTVERPDFHFEVVKYKLKENYEITAYDDVEQYIVKFHSKLTFFLSSQICGMVTYDAVAKTVTITCFPMMGYTESAAKETQAAIDKIEALIVNK